MVSGLVISLIHDVLYSISFLGDHLDMHRADNVQIGTWSEEEKNRDCIFQRMEMSKVNEVFNQRLEVKKLN